MRFPKKNRLIGCITITALSLVMLSGCGFKGPLYLPPPPNTLGHKSDVPTDQSTPQTPNETVSDMPTYSPFYQQNPSLEPAPRIIQ